MVATTFLPDIPTKVLSSVNEYLTKTLGLEYTSGTSIDSPIATAVHIRCQRADLPALAIVGRLQLETETSQVIPLSSEEIREIHECTAWYAARRRGELARDENGYILRQQGRRLASQWLDDHLSMKFYASGGLFIPIEHPLWQYNIVFKLKNLKIEPIGLIEVNAYSGEIEPIHSEQLQNIRERTHAIIRHQKPSSAT